jgi:FlaA1/EpsC-like NDP-sugar epimerase
MQRVVMQRVVMRPRSLIAAIHPRLAVVMHDLAMVWIAWISTNWLRYSLEVNPPAFAWFTPEIGIVLLAQGLVLWWTGLYKGLWRFASLPDLWNIMRASVIGSIAIAIALFLYNRLGTVPRAVLVIYPAALVVLLGAPRMAYRYWKDSRFDLATRVPAKRVLVLGAGRAGETLLRELARENRYRPVGVLDDNPALRGAKVHVCRYWSAGAIARAGRRVAQRRCLSLCRRRPSPRCIASSNFASRRTFRSAPCRACRMSLRGA